MNLFFKKILLVAAIFFAQGLKAQVEIKSTDLDRIKPKSVKKLIIEQQQQDILYFSDLKPSLAGNDYEGYKSYTKKYKVEGDMDEVWQAYVGTDQTQVWNNSKSSFAMLYSRKSDQINYADKPYFGLEKGLIYYLNLKVVMGFYKLPVAFEILQVDSEQKIIEMSYLKGGKASGKQIIRFTSLENGDTEVIHENYFKSESKFRDKYLYPYFHTRIINKFHHKMKKNVRQQHIEEERMLAGK